ncbi:MAG: Rnase Y domain-containing protein, partial [bacterium]
MSLKLVFVLVALAGVIGIALGYFFRVLLALSKKGTIEHDIKQLMLNAKEEAKKITLGAEEEAAQTLKSVREELKEKDEKIKKTEDRLIAKEGLLDRRQSDIEKEVEEMKGKIVELKEKKDKIDTMEASKRQELEKIAKMTHDEAFEKIVKETEVEQEEAILTRIRKIEQNGEERLEQKAKAILTTSIQRLANSVSPDIFVTSVNIPSDELKGKIIGKEGRNIKSFERETGVEVIVDDT